MKRHLLHRSKKDGYWFIGEKKGNRLVKNMQHLTCFASGMLALGSYHETDVLKKTQDSRFFSTLQRQSLFFSPSSRNRRFSALISRSGSFSLWIRAEKQ